MVKEKEEVQDFLKNLGIEYRYSCYSEKNPEGKCWAFVCLSFNVDSYSFALGCQLLGDYFTQIDGDFEKANKVFKDNCDTRNYGRSCSSYGLHQFYGRGTPYG